MTATQRGPFARQWQLRHQPAGRTGFAAMQRICPMTPEEERQVGIWEGR